MAYNHKGGRVATRRAKLLAGAGTAVLASLIATGAHAASGGATTRVDSNGVATALGAVPVLNEGQNSGNIHAEVSGQTTGVTQEGSQTGSMTTVTANVAAANAGGNEEFNSVDLNDFLGEGSEGVASLVVTGNDGVVASTVDSNELGIEINNAGDSTAAHNDGNTISVKTIANKAGSSVSGIAPANGVYSDGSYVNVRTPDAFENSSSSDFLYSSGGIVSSLLQTNDMSYDWEDQLQDGDEFFIGQSAVADENRIYLNAYNDYGSAYGGDVTSYAPSLSLDGNKVGASYTGNAGTNQVGIEAGGAPTFDGSIVLATVQQNKADYGALYSAAYSAAGAINRGTTISGTVEGENYWDGEFFYSNAFAGQLSVDGNEISASATGNNATGTSGQPGNLIHIGDGVSFYGDGGSYADADAYAAGYAAAANADASLAIANLQQNINIDMRASVEDAFIEAYAGNLEGGSLSASDNKIETTATGNAASSAIVVDGGAASFAGTAAISNVQSNYDSYQAAYGSDNWIEAGVGEDGNATDSEILVEGNLQRSASYGNSATQLIDLSAVDLSIDAPIWSGADEFSFENEGAVLVTNLQRNEDSTNAAFLAYSGISAYTDETAENSRLETSGNTQEAVAIGSNATNGIALDGVTVGSGGSILNVQEHEDSTNVAFVAASAEVWAEDATDSALVLTGNEQRAVSYANSAANSMTVKAAELTSYEASYGGTAFSVENHQDVDDSWISAMVLTDEDAGFSAHVSDDLYGSQLLNEGNSALAIATGNQASNKFSLDVVTLEADEDAMPTVASVRNDQDSYAGVYAGMGGELVQAYVGEETGGSEISVSNNELQTFAYGNSVGNELVVKGVDIATVDLAPYGNAYAGFSIDNDQDVGGTILADQSMEGPASVGAYFDDEVYDSTIKLEGNVAAAQAVGNLATSKLTIDANSLETSAYVDSSQWNDADVSARAGSGGEGMTVEGLYANGGGAVVTLDDDIYESVISVAGNDASVRAIGNSAGNVLKVNANSVEAQYHYSDAYYGHATDFSVDNWQWSGEDADVDASIYGSYGVQVSSGYAGAYSKVSVDDNSQAATAVANAANNSLTLDVTNNGVDEDGATSRLDSDQWGWVEVDADSDLQLFAPVNGEGSSISISDNRNTAFASVNDVSNVLKISGTNLGSFDGEEAVADEDGGSGDGVLANYQAAYGEVDVDADTAIFNDDAGQFDGSATLQGSVVSISGNVTTAEAAGNRAFNSATVSGGANQDSSLALVNHQQSEAEVDADASTHATVTLTVPNTSSSSFDPAVIESSIVLNGNSTAALARGNSANNVLVATSTRSYGTAEAGISEGFASAIAPAAMLNSQANSGAVSASATAEYGVVLNGGSSEVAAAGSTLNVNGNAVSATAVGNSASNAMTLTALNGGTAAGAVTNYQVNSGTVTATANSVNFGVNVWQTGLSGSTANVGNNQITATAVGNSAVTAVKTGN